jgi:chaperone required for assembly of F1-ATPase
MKRFYKTVAVSEANGGFVVTLDGRPVRTPGNLAFAVPHRALAEAVADEWRRQGETVDLPAMALSRFANTAIDRVAGRRAEVIRQVAAFGGCDLVCYRAGYPPELIERQSSCWDPLLDWLAGSHGARLATTTAIAPRRQAGDTLPALTSAVAAFDDFPLTALHMASVASGSVVIALALAAERIDAEEAWTAALVDELFQAERWGEDPEARRRREAVRVDLEAAERFFALCRAEAAA